MKKLLELKKIGKSFSFPEKTEILKDLSLEVFENESIAILGPSGVGKSTLLSLLGSLEKPSSGSIEIKGAPLSTLDANIYRREQIGFVFQAYNLLEDYTALDNVLIPARIARKSVKKGSIVYNRAVNLLEKVGLSDRLFHFAKQLSGGEKQRVCLARALCNEPSLILADEPTGNLDEVNSKFIHELLINLVKEMNKTLIVVTHDTEFANLCDKRYFLTGGKLTNLS